MFNLLQKIKWVDLFLFVGIVFIAIGIGVGYRSSNANETKIEIVKNKEIVPTSDVKNNKSVVIDVVGAVIKEGVYKLPGGSRIDDVLIVAGGLAHNADREWVDKNLNKAQILTDGQKIYIPKIGENKAIMVQSTTINEMANKLISINSAEVEDLDKLPGVGVGIAQRIIDYRKENGGFKSMEELKLVPGIGDKMYEKLKDKISL